MQPPADLLEAIEVCGVAGVVDNGPARCLDYIAAKAAVRIVEEPRSPMARWRVSDADARGRVRQVERLPPAERENLPEAEPADNVFHA